MSNQDVDQAAVAEFLKDAPDFTPAERQQVAYNLERRIARGEKVKHNGSYVSLATMRAAAQALREMDK